MALGRCEDKMPSWVSRHYIYRIRVLLGAVLVYYIEALTFTLVAADSSGSRTYGSNHLMSLAHTQAVADSFARWGMQRYLMSLTSPLAAADSSDKSGV